MVAVLSRSDLGGGLENSRLIKKYSNKNQLPLSAPASSALSQWQEMDHSYLNQSGQAWRVTGGLIQLEGECYRREIRRKKHWGLIIDSLFTQNLVSGQEVEEREADIPRPHQTHKLSPRPSVKDAVSSQFISYPGRLRQFKYATVNHLIVSELGFSDGFPYRSKPRLKWAGHKTIWVTRSNNDDLWLPIASPFLLPPFLIPDNSDVVTLQVLSRVTALRDNSSHGHTLPRMRMLRVVLMSELSWLVLTRFLVIYSQGPVSAIYYPNSNPRRY